LQNGASPLFIASSNGRREAVKALIERRANVEAAMNVNIAHFFHTTLRAHMIFTASSKAGLLSMGGSLVLLG
jgi:ankyrin repeat protein